MYPVRIRSYEGRAWSLTASKCGSLLPDSDHLQVAGKIAGAVILGTAFAYERRPRGWANHDLVEVLELITSRVKPSQ